MSVSTPGNLKTENLIMPVLCGDDIYENQRVSNLKFAGNFCSPILFWFGLNSLIPRKTLFRRFEKTLPGRWTELVWFRLCWLLPGVLGNGWTTHVARSRNDNGPGSLAQRQDDESGEARLLPLVGVRDGTVGRSCVDFLYRRSLHRRRARPKWIEAFALLRDARQRAGDGIWGWRLRCRPQECALEGRIDFCPVLLPRNFYASCRWKKTRARDRNKRHGQLSHKYIKNIPLGFKNFLKYVLTAPC